MVEKNTQERIRRSRRNLGKIREIWRRFRKSKSAMFGLVILLIFILVAVFADVIVPYEVAERQDASMRLLPPSWEHPFGTNDFGRDLFARVVHATPTSLIIGFSVSILSLIIGSAIGVSCAYYGGRYDDIVMRFIDILTSVPSTLLSMVVVAVLGPNMVNMIIAMTVARVRVTTRISRSAVFSIAGNEYIEAAKAGGASDVFIMTRHIIPNILGTLLVNGTMAVATCITTACGLSFLGLGVQPPTPEWGYMLNAARTFMRTSPHLMIIPGLAIMFSALSINLTGDGLRDALDPKLKN